MSGLGLVVLSQGCGAFGRWVGGLGFRVEDYALLVSVRRTRTRGHTQVAKRSMQVVNICLAFNFHVAILCEDVPVQLKIPGYKPNL